MIEPKPLRQPITRRLYDNPGASMAPRARLRMDPCPNCGEPLNTRLPMQKRCDKCRKKRLKQNER